MSTKTEIFAVSNSRQKRICKRLRYVSRIHFCINFYTASSQTIEWNKSNNNHAFLITSETVRVRYHSSIHCCSPRRPARRAGAGGPRTAEFLEPLNAPTERQNGIHTFCYPGFALETLTNWTFFWVVKKGVRTRVQKKLRFLERLQQS